MLRHLLLLFIVFLLYCKSFAITTYITFNPLNCITCSSGIYALCKESGIRSINVVVQSSYKEDSADIYEKYELHKQSKLNLIFSDSLYNALHGKENDAEFILFNDKTSKELYRGKLNQINLGIIRSYYVAEASVSIDSLCAKSVDKKLSDFLPYANYIITVSRYDKYEVITTPDNNETAIAFNDDFWVDLYKGYYKDSFEIKYPVIRQIMDEMPTQKPAIESIRSWDNSSLMITFRIKDYAINKNDTVINGMLFVGKYDIKNKKIEAVYSIDKSMPKGFFLYALYKEKDNYWGEGVLNDAYCMVKLSFNGKKNQFTYVATTKLKQPESYKIIKVSPLEEFNTTVNNGLLAFHYDDKITLLNNFNQVIIPFGGMFTDTVKRRIIMDLWQDESNYYILYKQKKVFHVLKFSKNKGTSKDIIVGYASGANMYEMKFYNSGNKLMYKPLDKNCLFIKEISFE